MNVNELNTIIRDVFDEHGEDYEPDMLWFETRMTGLDETDEMYFCDSNAATKYTEAEWTEHGRDGVCQMVEDWLFAFI